MNIDPEEQECEVEPLYDFDEIARGIRLLCAPTQVYEIRALGVYRAGTVSGYFDADSRKAMVDGCADVSGEAEGVYVTLNPVIPSLLARAVNRLREFTKHTTGDAEIAERRWLPLDFDPVRPAGISSTDGEHEAALAKARECRKHLLSLGFAKQSLVLADSGNGAHLLCRIELPNDDVARDLVKSCIDAVATKFSDEVVKVDRTTYNAARIWKVPGTLACKGDHTDDRPHRLARLVSVPKKIEPASVDLLRELAQFAPQVALPASRAIWTGTAKSFDLEAWLAAHEVPVSSPKPKDGGRIWVFPVCPWNPQHTNGSAFVMQRADGPIAAGCHHNGCQGKGWRELRALYERTSQVDASAARPAWLATASPAIRKKFEEAIRTQNNN
ncbi:MAG: hypothetical protein JNL96_22605 [Planctomycetaceae bacterium]|nr:hypothetical protein [Planctomycetaceae bacterium]